MKIRLQPPAVRSKISNFIETHICKLRVILRSRVLLGVCVLIMDIGRRLPVGLQVQTVACTRVNRVMLINPLRGNYKTRFGMYYRYNIET